jgi:hypothetical protein
VDFLSGAWAKIKSTAASVAHWAVRSPIEDLKAGVRAGASVQKAASTALTKTAGAAGDTLGKSASNLLWGVILPLIPLLVIVGAGWYLLRRRGA